MNSTRDDEGFVEPSNKARFLLLLLIIIASVSLYLITRFFSDLMPGENASRQELDHAVSTLGTIVDYLLFLSLLLAVLGSGYFVRFAAKIKRSGRVPPPGTWVITRTKIRRGKKANAAIRFSYFMCLLAWMPFVGSLFIKWMYSSFVTG